MLPGEGVMGLRDLDLDGVRRKIRVGRLKKEDVPRGILGREDGGFSGG